MTTQVLQTTDATSDDLQNGSHQTPKTVFTSPSRSSSPREAPADTHVQSTYTLILSNLTRSVNKNHIKEIIQCFAPLTDLQRLSPQNYTSCQYLVSFASYEEAQRVVKHLHGAQIDGCVIHVSWTEHQDAPQPHQEKKPLDKTSPRASYDVEKRPRHDASESPDTPSGYTSRHHQHNSLPSRQRDLHPLKKLSTSRGRNDTKSHSSRHYKREDSISPNHPGHDPHHYEAGGIPRGRSPRSRNRGSKYHASGLMARSTTSRSRGSASSWSSPCRSASLKRGSRSHKHLRSSSSHRSSVAWRHRRS